MIERMSEKEDEICKKKLYVLGNVHINRSQGMKHIHFVKSCVDFCITWNNHDELTKRGRERESFDS